MSAWHCRLPWRCGGCEMMAMPTMNVRGGVVARTESQPRSWSREQGQMCQLDKMALFSLYFIWLHFHVRPRPCEPPTEAGRVLYTRCLLHRERRGAVQVAIARPTLLSPSPPSSCPALSEEVQEQKNATADDDSLQPPPRCAARQAVAWSWLKRLPLADSRARRARPVLHLRNPHEYKYNLGRWRSTCKQALLSGLGPGR